MIDISDLQSDIFILKFLLGGTKQNQEREKYQHDSYKLSLTSIQEDPDSFNENNNNANKT